MRIRWSNAKYLTSIFLLIFIIFTCFEWTTLKSNNSRNLNFQHVQQRPPKAIIHSALPNVPIHNTVVAKKEETSHQKKFSSITMKYNKTKNAFDFFKFNCSKPVDKRHIKVRKQKIYQILMFNNEAVYLYKVYYDDRKSHWGRKYIQILAVGPKINKTIYADLWFGKNVMSKSVSSCSITKHGRDSNITSKIFLQYFFSCEIKDNDIPKYVSLSFDRCAPRSNLLHVEVPDRKWKHKFAICIETSYGHIDPSVIIEFVEYNKLMGVTSISVYPSQISTNNRKVFQQYEKEGIMSISETPSPLEGDSWKILTLSSPISFNDCMLRQMYSAEYIIPIDFDEILVPRLSAKNYSALLNDIDSTYRAKEPFSIYSFRTFIFFTTCGSKIQNPKFSNIFRFVHRLKRFGHLKSIVNPRKCLSVYNHYCKVNFKHLKGPGGVSVDTSLASVHHYRKSWSQNFCKLLYSENTIDTLCKDKFGKMLSKPLQDKYNMFKRLHLV
ncbi:uncharacterized protein LOC115209632 [Octopus sinensis]|uniref:Glycosyltransferase family 92 protein n=1 Tax=Octopus sinensis TaxID=2607531 RepID=A0A6P7S6W7_9MOLL|nr:uncharacterized protein LOC115209632 [Octopus sinensis]